MDYIYLAIIYFSVAGVFLLLNAFIAGFYATEITKKEWFDSLLWPVSAAIGIGILARIITEKIQDKVNK